MSTPGHLSRGHGSGGHIPTAGQGLVEGGGLFVEAAGALEGSSRVDPRARLLCFRSPSVLWRAASALHEEALRVHGARRWGAHRWQGEERGGLLAQAVHGRG